VPWLSAPKFDDDESDVYRADLQLGVVLTVPLPLLIVLATTHFENAHLVMPALSQHHGYNACACHQGSPDFQIRTCADGEHLVNRDLLANIRSNLFYFNFFASGNFVLLATSFYDRVHISPFIPASSLITHDRTQTETGVMLKMRRWLAQEHQKPLMPNAIRAQP
jgi:hypothetical protein